MFELLLVVIGALTLVALLLFGRSRHAGGDPSSSVSHFHRALSAMEPGGRGGAGDPGAVPGGADGGGTEGEPSDADPARGH